MPQELLILAVHPSSPPLFCGVRVLNQIVFGEVLCISLFVLSVIAVSVLLRIASSDNPCIVLYDSIMKVTQYKIKTLHNVPKLFTVVDERVNKLILVVVPTKQINFQIFTFKKGN